MTAGASGQGSQGGFGRRKRRSRLGRQQIHPYVAEEIHRRLKAYCARRGLTDSGVVEAALRQYLDQSSDAALIMRRLDRAGRQVERVRRNGEILAEFVSLWVRLWFAHTPQIPESAKAAAQASAVKRYEQFLEYVTKRLAGQNRLAIDLLGAEPVDEPPVMPAKEAVVDEP
jgi:hypothetical protein